MENNQPLSGTIIAIHEVITCFAKKLPGIAGLDQFCFRMLALGPDYIVLMPSSLCQTESFEIERSIHLSHGIGPREIWSVANSGSNLVEHVSNCSETKARIISALKQGAKIEFFQPTDTEWNLIQSLGQLSDGQITWEKHVINTPPFRSQGQISDGLLTVSQANSKVSLREIMGQEGFIPRSYVISTSLSPSDMIGQIDTHRISLGETCVLKIDGLASGEGMRLDVDSPSKIAEYLGQEIFSKPSEYCPREIIVEELLVGQEASVIIRIDGDNQFFFEYHTLQGMSSPGVHESNTMEFGSAKLLLKDQQQLHAISHRVAQVFSSRGVRGRIAIDFKGSKVTEVNNRPSASIYGVEVGKIWIKQSNQPSHSSQSGQGFFVRNTYIRFQKSNHPKTPHDLIMKIKEAGLSEMVIPFFTALLSDSHKFVAVIRGRTLDEVQKITERLRDLAA